MRPTPPIVFGVVEAAVAAMTTAVYLSAIAIDDGLEALLFLPVLAACSAVVAFGAGWRRRTVEWPLVAALTATVFTAALVASLGLGTDTGIVTPALVGVTVVVGTVAVLGGVCGWGAGRLARHLTSGSAATQQSE